MLEISLGLVVLLGALAGIALTVLTLPGIWLTILVAGAVALINPGQIDLWTLVGAVVLGLLAEATEFAASALGATKAGGTRRGAVGATVGALLGAILGTIFLAFIPVIGTIIGGAAGAGVGAIVLERTGSDDQTWGRSLKIGGGAAAGRLVATVLKVGFAVAIGLILTIAAFVP